MNLPSPPDLGKVAEIFSGLSPKPPDDLVEVVARESCFRCQNRLLQRATASQKAAITPEIWPNPPK